MNQTSLIEADTTTYLLRATSLPLVRNPGFILLSPEQIQQVAYDQHKFVYLAVNEVAIRQDDATVIVSTDWAVGKRNDLVILSGGWYELQYIRTSQGWQFSKVLQKWIS